MPEAKRDEFIQGLRDLAEFYAANPEMPLPGHPLVLVDCWKKEEFVLALRSMAHGGRVEKRTDGEKSIMQDHHAIRTFGSITLDARISKSMVCRKVRKLVEADVWECPDSLLEEA
jgi:hypothetical protein